MNKEIIWDKVGRVCIYLLFGLVPVFFLPFTAFPVAENKAMLAGVLVFIALGAFLAKILNTGKIQIIKTRFWFFLIAFLGIALISSALSASTQLSLWGSLQGTDSFINFVIFGLALFLTPLYLRSVGELIRALLFFSASLFVIAIYSTLQLFWSICSSF